MLDFNKETWVILTFRMVTILVEVWLLYKIWLLLWNHGVVFHSWVTAPVHKATIPLKKKSPAKKNPSAVKILPTQIPWHLCNGGYGWKQLQKYQWKGTRRFLFQSPAGLSQATDEPWLCLASPWKHIRTSGQPLPVLLHLPWGKVSPLNLPKAPFVVVAPCLPLSSFVLVLQPLLLSLIQKGEKWQSEILQDTASLKTLWYSLKTLKN